MLTGLCTLNFCIVPVLLEIRKLGQMHTLCLCPNAGMRYMHEDSQIELLLCAHCAALHVACVMTPGV